MLEYDPQPRCLGVCLSNDKMDLNSVMLRKTSKAAFVLSSMLRSTTSATLLNKLFSQLTERILLYAAEQRIPYVHPRKIDKSGLTPTFASPTSQLNTEDIWRRMVYSHYQLSATTPSLAVHSELGSFPMYISGVSWLANYMSYICSPWAPPLVHKAVLVQKAIASRAKFCWWNKFLGLGIGYFFSVNRLTGFYFLVIYNRFFS